MDSHSSKKISLISFIGTVMVLFIHSMNQHLPIQPNPVNWYVQEIIGNGFSRLAVPWFFMVSGYLFFRVMKENVPESIKKKLTKRIYTLLIPFIAWKVFMMFFSLSMQQIDFFNSSIFGRSFYINPLELQNWKGHIINNENGYHMWYLKDLIQYLIFTPLIYYGFKWFGKALLIPFFLIWLGVFQVNILTFSSEGVFFFLLGSYFAISAKDISTIVKIRFPALIWAVLVVAVTWIRYNHLLADDLIWVIHRVSILFGLMTLWSGFDRLTKPIPEHSIFAYAFFIYCFQEPFLTYLRVIWFSFIGTSWISSMLAYFIMPMVIVLVAWFIAQLLKKTVPNVYAIFSGTR